MRRAIKMKNEMPPRIRRANEALLEIYSNGLFYFRFEDLLKENYLVHLIEAIDGRTYCSVKASYKLSNTHLPKSRCGDMDTGLN